MKRKRKGACPSPLLDDSPKRTKVHAQRKFAQGSNVNSPVITPIKELESESTQLDVLQEPVQLLPLKRPNTEDFLTFLCFRGTPILPQSLNFLSTASIVDNNGQVHEIKSESSQKNGPIDIAKCGTSSEKPFIAFGVRKRADPIVISRQMDRKRRHALAIQALRRKYQEQKMAKIRALTISKLSEKVTNRTLVRTNTVSKTETVTKKSSTMQKTKVIATKHVKVTTRTLKTTLRPKIKPRMCLRSFRGRFVQKELPFRKRMAERKVLINPTRKSEARHKREKVVEVSAEKPEAEEKPVRKISKVEPQTTKDSSSSPRVTRSGLTQQDVRRKQFKKRMLINSTPIVVKPRSLRSTTLKKTIVSRRKSRIQKKKTKARQRKVAEKSEECPPEEKSNEKLPNEKPNSKNMDKAENTRRTETRKEVIKSTDIKKGFKKSLQVKKESVKLHEKNKRLINKSLDVKKEITKSNAKKDFNKTVEIKRSSRISNIVEKKEINMSKVNKSDNVREKQAEKKIDSEMVDVKVKNSRIENMRENQTDKRTSADIPDIKVKTFKNENLNEKEAEKRDVSETVDVKIKKQAEKKNDAEMADVKVRKNKVEIGGEKQTEKSDCTDMSDAKIKNAKSENICVKQTEKQNVAEIADVKIKEPEKITEFTKKAKKRPAGMPKLTATPKHMETKKKNIKTIDKLGANSKVVLSLKKGSVDVSADLDSAEIDLQSKKKVCLRNKPKADETEIKKVDTVKQKIGDKTDEGNMSPKMSQRPSRKTKEAAAIYMEILSHKLVDNKVDDDNVSIDSFPELPNVKKTEQRENELKAQAKTTKDDCKEKAMVKLETDLESLVNNHVLHSEQQIKVEPSELKENSVIKQVDNLKLREIKDKHKSKQADPIKNKKDASNEVDNLKLKEIQDKPKPKQEDPVKNKKDDKDASNEISKKTKIENSKEKVAKAKSMVGYEEIPPEVIPRNLRIKSTNISDEQKSNIKDGGKHHLMTADRPCEGKKEGFKTVPKESSKAKQSVTLDKKNELSELIDNNPKITKLKSDEKDKKKFINIPDDPNSNSQHINNPKLNPKILHDAIERKAKETEKLQDIPDEHNVLKDKEQEHENLATMRRKFVASKTTKPDIDDKSTTKTVFSAVVPSEGIEDANPPKRKTRNAMHMNHDQSDDSDESFHVDIKVPRIRKLTRSKVVPKAQKLKESIQEAREEVVEKNIPLKTTNVTKVSTDHHPKQKLEETNNPNINLTKSKLAESKPKVSTKSQNIEGFSSDSDHSTTSEVNLMVLANKAKNKKFSKTKSMKKIDKIFCESDEEPLSKLTSKSNDGSQASMVEISKKESKPKEVKTAQTGKLSEAQHVIKPKRECTKKPQNYLPMLSSSDEEEIFHGFDEKSKEISKAESSCIHAPPLLELLNQDVGRRFGKEKVNMSNEQIEKWLKDSALAGSSIKKENDEMLKFGERIPTETSLQQNEQLDTEKLKSSLLEIKDNDKRDDKSNTKITPIKSKEKTLDSKPQVLDRKLIFWKSKKDQTQPNVQAFSPENESSVYAFGEDNEEVISTPFRRPSRRPSSTATSRSEDESSKHDDKSGYFRKPPLKQDPAKVSKEESDQNADTDESSHQFYIPQTPSKMSTMKCQQTTSQRTKLLENKTLLKAAKCTDKVSESDDFKYKVPSSPSASSSSSAKLYKRPVQKQKVKTADFLTSVYVSDFPKKNEPARLVEAPVFHPTEQEFQDPLEYIERIRHKAEQFGLCRIVPPPNFKPDCKVSDDMRFTSYNQYVHKMLHRWGPNFKELMAIKKYLATQNISLTHPPWIGGMEIDLPRLYQTVQTLGGLKEVIEKKKWPKVSELMKIPKSAQDRVTKLDDIYCKYLLPYDTLSPAEREKLFDEVETDWAKKESKYLLKVQQKGKTTEPDDSDDDDSNECIVKGRSMALNAFYRIARNTMSMHFKNAEPAAQDVEREYWKHVTSMEHHICVHSGSIDSGTWGYGFAVAKNSPFARHPWNLKVLTNNNGSLLRSLGPIMGVTVPTLHVGMVFSACCWYRDPHGLPWIEYLHTGGSKIWYGIPSSVSNEFRTAMRKLMPNCCYDKEELWLASDTAMVPPALLTAEGVSLCRTVQDPGQFVVVFPKVFTSSISTGYVVSESVYFAPLYWLKTARTLFDSLRSSCESSMFSLDRLLLSLAMDPRCMTDILRQVLPHVIALCDKELELRKKLAEVSGDHVMERERMPLPEIGSGKKSKKKHSGEEGDYECELCRLNLFVSMVFDTHEGVTYCLDHGIEMIEIKKSKASNCKFMFTYDDDELVKFPDRIRSGIENKLQKKVPSKFAGMPTLLK